MKLETFPRRILLFLSGIALSGGLAFALHLVVDPDVPDGATDSVDGEEWKPADSVRDFFYPHYDELGRLILTVRGREATLNGTGGVDVLGAFIELIEGRGGDKATGRLSMESERAVIEVPGLDMEKLKRGVQPHKKRARGRGEDNRTVIVRFPETVRCATDSGVEFSTSGMVCTVVHSRRSKPEEAVAKSRLTSDDRIQLNGPGLSIHGRGFNADGESLVYKIEREARLEADDHIHELPRAEGVFPRPGGIRVASRFGCLVEFETGFIEKKSGSVRVSFPEGATMLDLVPGAEGDLRVESGIEAGTSALHFLVTAPAEGEKGRGGKTGRPKFIFKGLEAVGGVRMMNLGENGDLESAFTSQWLNYTRDIEPGGKARWSAGEEGNAWLWGGALWQSGIFLDIPTAPDGEAGHCLHVWSERAISVRDDRAGGKTVLSLPGKSRIRSWRGLNPLAAEDPHAFLTNMEERIEAHLKKGFVDSVMAAGKTVLSLTGRGRSKRLDSCDTSEGISVEEYGPDGETRGRIEGDTARFREHSSDGERVTSLEVGAPTVFILPGTSFQPFGQSKPFKADDRFSLRFEGSPTSVVTLKSISRIFSGRWADTDRYVDFRGGGKIFIDSREGMEGKMPRTGRANLLEGEKIKLRFSPRGDGGKTRWVPEDAVWEGSGRFTLVDSRGGTFSMASGK
ncbi:MAG: hypothetical protein ACYTFG_18515, partial [Planctomycetota bacterium]